MCPVLFRTLSLPPGLTACHAMCALNARAEYLRRQSDDDDNFAIVTLEDRQRMMAEVAASGGVGQHSQLERASRMRFGS